MPVSYQAIPDQGIAIWVSTHEVVDNGELQLWAGTVVADHGDGERLAAWEFQHRRTSGGWKIGVVLLGPGAAPRGPFQGIAGRMPRTP